MTFIASTQAQAHPHPRCKGELHEEFLLNSAKPRLRAARAWSATGLFSLLLSAPLIVSKRLGSPYRSGRSPHWAKVKNPNAAAVKREAEEDWGR